MQVIPAAIRASLGWATALSVVAAWPLVAQAQTSYRPYVVGASVMAEASADGLFNVWAMGPHGELLWRTGWCVSCRGSMGWDRAWQVAPPYAPSAEQVFEFTAPLEAGLGAHVLATSVNASGTVVGHVMSVDADYMKQSAYAARWTGGHVEPLTDDGVPVWGGEAWAINEVGQIAGDVDSNYFASGGDTTLIQPVIWDQGQLLPLPVPKGSGGRAVAINRQGVAVGYSYADSFGTQGLPLRWRKGQMYRLPTSGQSGRALSINATGDIVGSVGGTAALWRDHGKTLVKLAGGSAWSEAKGINRSGQVVGAASVGAVLWTPSGELRPLNDLVPAAWKAQGWQVTQAKAINDRGDIAAACAKPDASGSLLPFPCVLRPVP